MQDTEATIQVNPLDSIDINTLRTKLIQTMKKCQFLWKENQQKQQSLKLLQSGLKLISYLNQRQTDPRFKQVYEKKHKQLIIRYQNRKNGKEQININYEKKQEKAKTLIQQLEIIRNQVISTCQGYRINLKWQDVVCCQKTINQLKQFIILPKKFPQIFKGPRRPHQGVMIYGPPGVGKTFLAHAAAIEGCCAFFPISATEFNPYKNHNSANLVNKMKVLFKLAIQKQPSVILIDNLQFLQKQNEQLSKVKTQLIINLNMLWQTQVICICVTSQPWTIDRRITRRLYKQIYIQLPKLEQRKTLLRNNFVSHKHSLIDRDFYQFALKTQAFSISDILVCVRQACMQPVRKLQKATKFNSINGKWKICDKQQEGRSGSWQDFMPQQFQLDIISKQDVDLALSRIKPSIDKDYIKKYEQFTQQYSKNM